MLTVPKFQQDGTGAVNRDFSEKLSEFVSVKDFGAVGDGVTDDTAAIQAALDYANTSTTLVDGGLGVFVPSGVYKITSTLSIYSNTTFYGVGASSIIHLINNLRSGAITGVGAQVSPLYGITVRDLTIYGDASYSGGVPSVVNGAGVDFQFVDKSLVENCLVSGFSDGGIFFLNGNYNKICKNTVRYVAQGAGFNANAISVYGNILSDNIIEVIGTYNGLHLEGSFGTGLGNGEVIGTSVTGNTVKSCYEHGINLELAPYSSCAGNTVISSGAGGTAVNDGIHLFGAYGSTVVGNTIVSSAGYGIDVSADSGNSTISGNTTILNSTGSMSVNDGSGTATTNNVTVGDNNLTEGDLVTSGNVSFINRTRGFKFSNVAVGDTTTLDWYQEGTFTPVVEGTSSAGTGTYSTQLGVYTRVGNMVHFNLRLAWSAHTGTGDTQITGLPFTSAGTLIHAVAIYNNGHSLSAGNILQGFVPQSQSYVTLNQYNPATGGAASLPIDTSVADIAISGSYRV